MRFLVFAASHRPDSVNRRLAKLAQAQLESRGAHVDFAEYAEFDAPVYNDAVAQQGDLPPAARAFADRAAHAHGMVISSPEYNWSYPGSLKTIIDWTSRLEPNPVAGKTVLLMSATPGSRGGILGLDHLRSPLGALQMYVFPRMFPLGGTHGTLDGSGLIQPKHQKQFVTLIDDFLNYTRKLCL